MTNIVWPDNTREITNKIRNTIGRDITIYTTTSGVPCPDCGELDPVTNLSTDQFCETCGGNYWINTTSAFVTKAHVIWKGADVREWEAGGYVIDGDCLIQVEHTPAIASAVDVAASFYVDEKVLVKNDVTFRGVPEINRILVTLEQEDD